MSYAPLFLDLKGAKCLIVGGGTVAMAKAETLLGFGAAVHVVAKEVLPELQRKLLESGNTYTIGIYHPAMLSGARIVIAATDDRILNKSIRADAAMRNVLVNVVDDPSLCDFIFPAIVQRGPVQVAVSSAGISPTLARYLKRRIEQVLPWNLHELAAWISERKQRVAARLGNLQVRRMFWDEVIAGPIAQEVLEGNHAKAEDLLAQALADSEDMPKAALYLIGAGPGHPDLMTVRAAQLLSEADVILYDRLIPHDALARYARRDAEKILAGKSSGDHSLTQAQIGALIEQHLRANKIVVRLKGGDPGIYAHAAEEIDVARRLGVPWQIVPGITAAAGCAAMAGIPLTEREGANAVRILTLYDETLHDDNFWYSLALARRETLVFYMATRQREFLCRKLIESGFSPTMPMLLIEQGTTPEHAEYEATIGTFAERYANAQFITPALLIVGDVVRWRSRHGWKEPSAERRAWFARSKDAVHGE